MNISYNWLKQYVDLDLPAEEVEEMLTGCGLEVERMISAEEVIFQIGLTPNRGDATSHIGIARDLVAVLNNFGKNSAPENNRTLLHVPDVSGFKPDNNKRRIDVAVEDITACPRYSGLTITNVNIGESPGWLQNRLLSVGLRPINNIVDITNYILMEVGQPLHAFDADEIDGEKIVIKKYPSGTPFTTLDEVDRELTGNDLMICSTTRPMCIAGVFGGVRSGVTESTKNIFLESACFDPVTIRQTARFHGLQTDASFRFERGTDIGITPYALKRAALMIKEIAGGEIASEIVDVYPRPVPNTKVSLRFVNLDRLIGKQIPRDVVKSILQDLEILIEHEDDQGLDLVIPSCKVDVTREADVIEEVLRIYGYNNVEIPIDVKSSLTFLPKPDPDQIRNVIAEMLSVNGFFEIINNSLTRSTYYQENAAFPAELCVNILNPTSRDLNVMRQTLLYGGLETIVYNQNRKAFDLKLYEMGTIYSKAARENEDYLSGYREQQQLALFLTGRSMPENWDTSDTPVDLYQMKGYLYAMLTRLSIDERDIKLDPFSSSILRDGFSCQSGNFMLITAGHLRDSVLKQFEIKLPVLFAAVDMDLLLKLIPEKELQYKELLKFPEVRRDIALMLDKEITFNQIKQVAYQTEKKILRDVGLFDVYEGDQIETGKKSYAVSFQLCDDSKTLTDAEIDKVMDRMARALEQKLGAKIR